MVAGLSKKLVVFMWGLLLAFWISPLTAFAIDETIVFSPTGGSILHGFGDGTQQMIQGFDTVLGSAPGVPMEVHSQLYIGAGGGGTVTANLYADSGGSPDFGTLLATSDSVNNDDLPAGSCGALTTFTFPSVTLTTGTRYWIEIDNSEPYLTASDVLCGSYTDGNGLTGVVAGGVYFSDGANYGSYYNAVYEQGGSPTPSYGTSTPGVGIALSTSTNGGVGGATVIYDPSQTIFNGFILFLAAFALIIFYFRRK